MHHDTSLIDIIAVGLAVAFVLGTLAQKVKLSPLVGYLLAGVCVGPFTPGFVADQTMANQLSELGVMLLMFGVGLHFSLDDLMEVKWIAVPGALAQIVVATLLGWALAWSMGWPLMQGLVFGLALSVASTVVLLRALEERRLLETQRGRIAVGWLIVEDLVMVIALVLLPALANVLGGSAGAAEHAGESTSLLAALGWTLLKMVAFVAVMLVVGRRVIPWSLEKVAATGSRELFTLAVLGIALGVAFGSAKLFGVSFALGAFFAGMLLKESELSHKAASDSLPLRDAFAVLFFVSVGMLFDPMILIAHPWQVLATFLTVTVGKSLAAFVIVRAFGHPTGTALTISTSLAQIGEFSFILAGLGVQLAILPETGRDLILAGALLSIVANPFLFSWLDRWQAKQAQDAPATVEPELPPGPPLQLDGHAIVIGYGRVGSALAQLLRSRGVPVLVIDDNGDHVAKAHAAGIPGIRGSAAADRVLAEARPEQAKIAILAIPQPLEAGEALAKLRALNPSLTLLARAHSDAEVKHLLEHGADGAVLAERELAYSLAEMVMSTPPYRALRVPAS
ncbi:MULTISPECIES: YbaL family putative K(+) efflux transporter [Xanthomonas]|uniref:YbaL family putative K(+) efflux transporter n=1 Tax=Xanthomonas campestris pv. papavericola TaxID=487881 RepID=A0AAJ3CC05_XANCA|nr:MULTISPECIES: YbaL family putative K(+) efflux transporter [Xanthomonas]AEL08243.1 cation:proton antiporter [Xanthomonas campestris pv. raphani 756C]AKS15419.1 cation:proton antiport protein [Xanthomonas campestris pv. campestris]AKS19449.1 cation:proton antiport protein [Xanthomonas campestris pv. campestris]ALE69644.1 cation:proton antiport protein [Xanthomonas campestris pv. campestris]MCC5049974.1 Kef family K(+) transporter [Xanthomonas campestris pv. aberrans]